MSGKILDHQRFYISVKGLVFYGDKFLILKRSTNSQGQSGFWEFPGGRLEFGENAKEGLKREIFEETGLQIDVAFPIGSWEIIKNDSSHILGLTFLARTDNYNVVLSEEHTQFQWINKEEISNYKVFPKMLEEVEEWNWFNINNELDIKKI